MNQVMHCGGSQDSHARLVSKVRHLHVAWSHPLGTSKSTATASAAFAHPSLCVLSIYDLLCYHLGMDGA
jgi:hypothetical protein